MPYVTENDYKKLAEAAADDLMLHKIPLNQSITKLAEARQLNHEQVARLCEATNNVAFNKLFQARDKTAEDRIIEFDVADPRHVLGGAIKQASADNLFDTPEADVIILSEFRPLGEDTYATKVAAAVEDVAEPARMRPEHARRTVRKTHEYLRSEKIAEEMLYQDALYNVKAQFSRLYRDHDFPAFEKEAAALYQERAREPLRALRRMFRMPDVQYDFSILQKQAGYIDDRAPEFKLFSEAMDHAEKITTLTLGIAKLEKLL